MNITKVGIIAMFAFAVAPTLLSGAQAYADDANIRTVINWGASQAVVPSDEIHSTLGDAKEQVCDGRERSHGCRIGGTAIDGAGVLITMVGLAATLGVIGAVVGVITRVL